MGHTSEFRLGIYWWTLKTWKIRILKNEKKKCWRYHFSHVYQKPQSYEVHFLRYSVLGHFLPFYPSPPNKKRKPKFWKEENSICKYHHFKLVQQEIQSYDMLTQIWSVTDIIFYFRSFFGLLSHYWPQKLKFGKNLKNIWILSFYTCVP